MELLDFEEDGKQFSILLVDPSYSKPVKFLSDEYIRIGENVRRLKDHEEHERALWLATSRRKLESAVALSHQSPGQVLEKLSANTFYERAGQTAPQNSAEKIRKFMALGAISRFETDCNSLMQHP
jgi:predicted HTH transcriptional regulator